MQSLDTLLHEKYGPFMDLTELSELLRLKKDICISTDSSR